MTKKEEVEDLMTGAQVTIVVVPRERFSFTSRSLESIYAHTDFPFSLVCVDGGSPGRTRRYLAEKSRKHNFKLIRTKHYLSPNQARNLGFRHVKSKYVVFIDNDVLVNPGWLTALVGCAEKTGAWVVGPLTFNGNADSQTIHVAGGIVNVREEQGERVLHISHDFLGESLADVASDLSPQKTGLAEFHCMLMLTEAYRKIGEFDEQLLSVHEHEDVCLAVSECGGAIYFEPRSVVTAVTPPPLSWSDLPFFMLRWSEAWNLASHQHFENKWVLRENDERMSVARRYAQDHRRIYLWLVRGVVRRICRVCDWQPDGIEKTFLFPFEQLVNRGLVRLFQRTSTRARSECAGSA